jgi:chemotaxis protein MotB
MMSLFIVLWLMNSSEKIKKAVAGYFNDPKGTSTLMGTTMSGTGPNIVLKGDDESLKQLKSKLEAEIQSKPELKNLSKQIEITITPEGLRIELIEDKNGTFYQSGSPHLSDKGQELLALLAGELKGIPNPLLIEGHTDATQYSNDASYSNWELSADRANSARRLLQQDGVRANQVTQVRGYADQFLRVKSNPYDPSNRRISILVKNANGMMPNIPQNYGKAEPVKPDAVLNSAKAPATPAPPPASPNAAAKPANTATANSAQTKPSPAKPANTGLVAKLEGLFSSKKK